MCSATTLLLHILLAWLLLSNILLGKVLLETDIEESTHVVLPHNRLIVDNLISSQELKILMEYSLEEQELQKPQYDRFRKAYQTFSVSDFRDIITVIDDYFLSKLTHQSHSDNNKESGFPFRLRNNTAINTITKMRTFMKTAIAVQMRIVDYAETFFNRRFKIKSGSIFLRKQINDDYIIYRSPEELNQADGWLVPIHADNCMTDDLLECDKVHPTREEKIDFITRDVSVIAFLNELPDDSGGEFTFIDADRRVLHELKKKREQEQRGPMYSEHHRKTLRSMSQESASYTNNNNKHSADLIPPPSRESIRRALSNAIHAQHKRVKNTNNRERLLHETEAQSQFVKAVNVPTQGCNYTLVLPLPGRVVIFNSSLENVHAATNLLRPGDHRYTLFMFLTVDKN